MEWRDDRLSYGNYGKSGLTGQGGGNPTDSRAGPDSGAALLRRALAYLRSYKREAAGAFFALILVSGANLVTPLLIGRAIDDGIRPGRLNVVLLVVAALVGLALARGLFQFLQGYLAERASQGVAYDLRDSLFARIERLSFSYHDRAQTGQLAGRADQSTIPNGLFDGSEVAEVTLERITVQSEKMGGVPCIRGLRIPVSTVVGMVADGLGREEILDAYPDLEEEDIHQALRYAADAVGERQLPLLHGPA